MKRNNLRLWSHKTTWKNSTSRSQWSSVSLKGICLTLAQRSWHWLWDWWSCSASLGDPCRFSCSGQALAHDGWRAAEVLCNPQAETSPEESVSTKFINTPPVPAGSELLHQQPVNKGQDLVIDVHTWRKACMFYIILTDVMNGAAFQTRCLSWVNDVQKLVSSALIVNFFPLPFLCLSKASLSLTINSWSSLLSHLLLQAPPHSLLLSPQSSAIPAEIFFHCNCFSTSSFLAFDPFNHMPENLMFPWLLGIVSSYNFTVVSLITFPACPLVSFLQFIFFF